MDTKNYTVTFDSKCHDLEAITGELQAAGVKVLSVQRFLRTAVISARAEQLAGVNAMAGVAAVVETTSFGVGRAVAVPGGHGGVS